MRLKRFYLVLFSLLLIFLISSCTSDDELKVLKQENESLKANSLTIETDISALKQENESLKKENESLKNDVEELKNGAVRRIEEIRDAFAKSQYDSVLDLSSQLAQLHPGSEEAIEAQGLVDQVDQIKKDEQAKADAEAEKARQEAEKSAQDKVREIIRVKSVYPSEPNSAGGVDLHIVWQNKSEKTVKYAYFTVEPYNAVGDVVSCTIRWTSEFRGKVTGPIELNAWEGENTYWECAWYNSTITKVKLLQIDIEYMDGTTASMKDSDIDYVIY